MSYDDVKLWCNNTYRAYPGSAEKKLEMNKHEKSLMLKKQWYKRSRKETTVVWTRGTDGGEKTKKCSFTSACRGKEKQRATEKDLDGKCPGSPERQKYGLDQDW